MGAWQRWIGPLAIASVATWGGSAPAQYSPPGHTQPPPFLHATPPEEMARLADLGVEIDRGRTAAEMLAEHRRLERILQAIGSQRKGRRKSVV